MILNQETLDKFGYNVKELSDGSSKKVVVKCDYCSELVDKPYKAYLLGWQKFPKDACKKCKFKKREDLCLKTHGVKNVMQLPETVATLKNSMLEKYGVDSPAKLESVQAKMKATNLERYGVENPIQNVEVRQRYKDTCMEKYGVDNVSSVEAFKEKRKVTHQEKYGVDYYTETDHLKGSVKEKYGVDNVFQLDSTKEKSRETNLKHHGVENAMQNPEISGYVGKKSLETKLAKGDIMTHEGRLVSEIIKDMDISKGHFYNILRTRGWDAAINYEKGISNIEMIMKDFLDTTGLEYRHNEKMGKYYPDFIVGDVIIECDGLYYHSDARQSDDNYHMNKREYYVENGYKPLFFRSDEIENQLDIVKSIILNKLGKTNNRVFARKTKVVTLGSKLSKKFFEENHLMGNGSGITLALEYNGLPICAIKMRNRGKGHWEISRFCPKIGYSVVGGFTRLLSSFKACHEVTMITTFIDRRYGDGSYLTSLGFEHKTNYKSFKWTDGNQSYHRMKFRSNSGYDKGLCKVWDCGQAKYIYAIS